MSLDFLSSTESAPPAETPFTAALERDGATFDVRHNWRVAADFPGEKIAADKAPVRWADVSDLHKLELQFPSGAGRDTAMQLGTAVRVGQAWLCLLTPWRALAVSEPGTDPPEVLPGARVLDVTTQYAALRLDGPAARDTLARFCALDLRPAKCPVGSCLPGSVARTPGVLVCESDDQYLVLVGAALAEYLWTVVSDAGRKLGGRPVAASAFEPIAERPKGSSANA